MKVDYTAANLFLSYCEGDAELEEVWKTKAYKTIRLHADKLKGGICKKQIEDVLKGEKTGYYGIGDLKENLNEVRKLMKIIKNNEDKWTGIIEQELERVVPKENVDNITVNPVFGYDIGIGLNNNVCVNLNEQLFFDKPEEFMFIAMHESSHVLYDRINDFPSIDNIQSVDDKITFFNTFFQTEGYAVYTPLNKRKDEKMDNTIHFILEDYQVMADEEKMKESVSKYDDLKYDLKDSGEWSFEEYMKRCFGKDRLAYRVGGMMVKKIEEKEGIDEVREAFYKKPDDFVNEYNWVLDEFR